MIQMPNRRLLKSLFRGDLTKLKIRRMPAYGNFNVGVHPRDNNKRIS